MSQMFNLTWGGFEAAIAYLAERLAPCITPDMVIVAPPRGGLCLAVRLSHVLAIPFHPTADGTDEQYSGPLVWVDDVIDQGLTYTHMRHIHASALAAVWVSKNDQLDGFIAAQFTRPDTWVIFPWEIPQTADADRVAYMARRNVGV